MSRTQEEIRDQMREHVQLIKDKYKEKHEDLEVAERIDIFLSLLAEQLCWDVTWKVQYQYYDDVFKQVVTKTLLQGWDDKCYE